eukprot:TRINITY_DN8483_c0_g1_i1.p3 TRINITY_DN8483_c0_g1~~TRINITY_DN8483_c0_g1_i1.p3  ORF type:complete len:158 (-),score=65.58 TRINITY_DN8483_c0_g1_i1:40-513(-)
MKEEAELAKYGKPKDAKMSRFEMQQKREKADAEAKRAAAKAKTDEEEDAIPENTNRLLAEEAEAEASGAALHARGIDEAVSKMSLASSSSSSSSSSSADDKHPEKRLKAAFSQYEERELPLLRADNPGLKLSQVKEILWKQWQKSPENPLVQAAMAQ